MASFAGQLLLLGSTFFLLFRGQSGITRSDLMGLGRDNLICSDLEQAGVGITHALQGAAPSSHVPLLGSSWACVGPGFGQDTAVKLDPRFIFREGILGSPHIVYGLWSSDG